MASVSNPLDDGSFIYAVRAAAVKVGETRQENRYFRPDRNPVVFAGLRKETVSVPAGTYTAVVVAPTIRTKGMFAEGGEAQVWFSDDDSPLSGAAQDEVRRVLDHAGAAVGDVRRWAVRPRLSCRTE